MQLFAAFMKLVRWRNLFFIVLTQTLFFTCVLRAVVEQYPKNAWIESKGGLFILLVIASVCIAAAGYIINDYFDLQIDAVNRPGRIVVNRIVKRRWAIFWHLCLSVIGLVLSIYISYKTKTYIIALGNAGCILLLWFYSTTFKKQVLTGNVIIAALTAWVIVVVYFFAGAKIIGDGNWKMASYPFDIRKFFILTMAYAGFAFVLSLIREVIKDLEDMEGDAQYQCRTMPIVWGVPAAKVFVAVWQIVLLAALAFIALYAFKTGWRWQAVYVAALVWIPLLMLLKPLKQAVTAAHFHRMSTQIKWVMLAGILSMCLFYSMDLS